MPTPWGRGASVRDAYERDQAAPSRSVAARFVLSALAACMVRDGLAAPAHGMGSVSDQLCVSWGVDCAGVGAFVGRAIEG